MVEGGFEHNAERLVVRIYPEDQFAGPLAGYFVQRTDLAGTSTALAVDVGPSLMPVQRLVAAMWGVADRDLFERAIQNLERMSTARWSHLPIAPAHGFGIDMLGEDFHAPAHVLLANPRLPRTGKAGNLIGIPACGVLFSYPIDKALDALTLETLAAISLGKYQDGPNAITPHLVWRPPDGGLHVQRVQRHGKGTRFLPSPEFVECMIRLQQKHGGAAEA
jgi:hypothetical protein